MKKDQIIQLIDETILEAKEELKEISDQKKSQDLIIFWAH